MATKREIETMKKEMLKWQADQKWQPTEEEEKALMVKHSDYIDYLYNKAYTDALNDVIAFLEYGRHFDE